ncbi:MAG: DUF3592 domain-containing protein [Clostridiaceae bacterium]|nr:DUF3592 domain-containing protein [Clostridiaceae bacterium]
MVRVTTRTKFHLGRRGTIVLCAILGIALILIGIGLLSRSAKFSNKGVSVEAKVSDIKVSKSSKSTTYTPHVTFDTLDGKTVSVSLNVKSTNRSSYSVGDKVKIIYLQEDPTTVIMDSFFNKYGFPVLFIMGGILCLFLGVKRIISPRP